MLLPVFEWLEATAIGNAIRDSLWLFPVIESIHLVALAVIGGALLIVDLRLFGVGLRSQPVRQLAEDAQPWLIGSLLVMVATGVPLFLSEAIKCYYSTPFWWKITALPIAILFTFTVRRKAVLTDQTEVKPWRHKLVGLASLGLWFTVAAAGRWIGFSG
jgi:hypothetical protein